MGHLAIADFSLYLLVKWGALKQLIRTVPVASMFLHMTSPRFPTTLRRPDTRRPRRLAWDAHHSLCANRQPCADGKTHADGKREDGQPALRRRERPTVVAATLGMCDLGDAADLAKCKRPAPCSQCTTATAFIQNIVCREEEEWKIFVIPLPPPQKMSKKLAKSVLYHLKGQDIRSSQNLNMIEDRLRRPDAPFE